MRTLRTSNRMLTPKLKSIKPIINMMRVMMMNKSMLMKIPKFKMMTGRKFQRKSMKKILMIKRMIEK